MRRQSTISSDISGPPSRRLTRRNIDQGRSRHDILAQAAARYYVPQTQHLSTASRRRNFAQVLENMDDETPRIAVNSDELRRFSIVQVKKTKFIVY